MYIMSICGPHLNNHHGAGAWLLKASAIFINGAKRRNMVGTVAVPPLTKLVYITKWDDIPIYSVGLWLMG